jgi:hypothetical protein
MPVIPATQEMEMGKIIGQTSKASLDKNLRHCLKITKAKCAGVSLRVEYLPCKFNALSLNPSTAKKTPSKTGNLEQPPQKPLLRTQSEHA